MGPDPENNAWRSLHQLKKTGYCRLLMSHRTSPLTEIEQRIQDLLGAERDGATTTVQELLIRAHRLAAWQNSAPDELQASITEQMDAVANELLDILLGWTSLGGRVELGVANTPLGTPEPKVVSSLPSAGGSFEAPEQRAAPPTNADTQSSNDPDLDTEEQEPASIDQLHALQRHVEDGGTMDLPALAREDWQELLAEMLSIGAPREDTDGELVSIQAIIDQRERWQGLPRRIQCLIIEWLTARLRHLQIRSARDWRVEQGFTVLTHYSRTEQPGFSYGLARSHDPRNDSWADDAAVHLDELRRLIPKDGLEPFNKDRLLATIQGLSQELDEAPDFAEAAVSSQLVRAFAEALNAGVNPRDTRLVNLAASWLELLEDARFRPLRRAVREDQGSLDASLEKTYDAIPEDWDWWGRTQGRRAVMLGGSPREKNRARLEQEFRFSELVWDPAEHKRNVLQRLRSRIRSGGVDLVIVLRRFVGHDTDDVVVRSCKESGVDWVHVEHGYGVNQVQAAIERFLTPAPPEA